MLENNTINDGISRADAEKILINFLNDESLKVLAIKGRWGVGKTHLVQNVLEKSSGKQFYYSSMFGVSSLEQLKGQILLNVNKPTINESNPQKNWHQLIFNPIKKLFQSICETIKKPFQSVLSWISQNSSQVSKIPKIEDLSLLGSIKVPLSGAVISIGGDLLLNYLFSTTSNSIICIDDLERKSSSFQLDELLGFVDYLVQKLHSKVILIYNEDRLFNDKLSKENLNDYREKIIDIEISLNPKTEENILLVFKNEHDL
jgi:Cdc6-like AAA superfamily ATPase